MGAVFLSPYPTSYGSSLEEYGILPAFVELAQADSHYNDWHLELLLPCWTLQNPQYSALGPSTPN